jgi:hypothetical protein
MTACGVQPVATVTYQCDNVYLYSAVEPTTGASFFLALPYLNSRAFQRCAVSANLLHGFDQFNLQKGVRKGFPLTCP